MVWFLLLMVLGAGFPAFGQGAHGKKAPGASRWPIESLAVEGNHNYSREQILAVAGLTVGQMAGKQEFEAARDRLVAAGVFETVGYRFAPEAAGKGYAASFQVVEAEPAYPMAFERLGVSTEDLLAWLRDKDPLFAPKLAATKQVIERYRKWVEEYVTAHGGAQEVVAKVTPEGTDQFTIVFRPPGTEPVIAEVKFTGNQVLPAAALQKAISQVAIGAPFQEDRFRQMLDATIRPLYDARGRVRVAFPNITVENASDVQGLAVTVAVEEGGSYDLGNVKITGTPDFDADDLVKAAKIKTGDLANFDEIGEGVDRIKKRMAHQGFMRSEVQIVRRINENKKTVDVTLKVDEGPQYMFGTLNVEGLDLNGEAAIRKMWSLKQGEPFKPEYAKRVLERVKDEGLFDNLGDTRAETQVNDKSHTVDVTLFFKGSGPKKKKEDDMQPGPIF